ncbi:siderophore-interacting protein [Microbacterium thalassium]|uniref:NADPH-dependent ferric siderophore reductase n=1 Tax=Microbacterium thalassium TaxID=362649 RepID=A0A7X0FM17_9MICO|nr:siderophore-interacting protein [Microbacterium thalassium]MBB6389946.1 NADPH-dependent ferric siderophore reductase [Microbacterium thalassium]GLK24632.1 siderophore-interacting protein [Microbacterium thalassium]
MTTPFRGDSAVDSPFRREGGRNRFTARRAQVVDVAQVAPAITRVRVTGPDFADFVSAGPSDHIRVFFPDPATGELVAPEPVGSGEDGIVRPDRPTHARDFTPLPAADWDGPGIAVDIDFFLHPSPGPASAWATHASPSQELVVVGPRGSKRAPQGVSRVLLVCDETALPSATRWAAEVPSAAGVDVIAVTGDDGGWVAEYLSSTSGRQDVRVAHVTAGDAAGLLAAIDAAAIDDSTYVFAAGEASALVPVRRHLRRTLELPPEQVALSGYWKNGATAFDHHSPVDPSDPD